MFDYINAIILGIVQGITEFIPISSSGHLILFHQLFQLNDGSDLNFDVALNAGTLLSMLVYFWKDIIKYTSQSKKFVGAILLSCIPAGLVGFFFEDIIDASFRSPWVVVVMLFVVSLLFFAVEATAQATKKLEQLADITWSQAILIGCAQAVALIPGTSRSGITTSMAMWLGFERKAAARFSFLMVIPLSLALTAKKTLDVAQAGLTMHQFGIMAVGTIVSAVVGLAAIHYLLAFFQKHTLKPFAWYRIGLAVVVSLILLTVR